MMRKLRTIEMNRLSVDEFKSADKLPLIVILDDVRSMHNVGSVFRTSDAFRLEAVYLCGITSTPPSAEIHKTALGAEDSVDWKYYTDVCEAVRELQSKGYEVYAVEQAEGSTMLQDFIPRNNSKYAVI
jgi:tRNA G18 (ribose-2'-O)-methylase SpoU